jgi:hypothetical protein
MFSQSFLVVALIFMPLIHFEGIFFGKAIGNLLLSRFVVIAIILLYYC